MGDPGGTLRPGTGMRGNVGRMMGMNPSGNICSPASRKPNILTNKLWLFSITASLTQALYLYPALPPLLRSLSQHLPSYFTGVRNDSSYSQVHYIFSAPLGKTTAARPHLPRPPMGLIVLFACLLFVSLLITIGGAVTVLPLHDDTHWVRTG